MNIEWYPGHIDKARRDIKQHLKEVDIVIEIIDARCPMSSINFLYNEIKNKKRLIVVNKVDLVDKEIYKTFNKDILKLSMPDFDGEIIYIDSRKNNINKDVDKKIAKLSKEIIEKNIKKGIVNPKIKAIVVGMPNVGKSTFINSYVKKRVNHVENKPGITKKMQWTKLGEKLLLLDTPGITSKKFINNDVGINLALVGSINDNIIEKQELVYELVKKTYRKYYIFYIKRYNLKMSNEKTAPIDVINEIASINAMRKKDGDIDYNKVSNMILNDFRKGLIGKISLE